MFVKIQIFATKDEFFNTKEDFEELNEEEFTIDMFKQDCIDRFFADRSDYLDPDKCTVYVSDEV